MQPSKETTQIQAVKMIQKAAILIFIIFIFLLAFAGYRVWRFGEILRLGKYGADLLQSTDGKKSDDFQVGNGTRIFLVSKLHPSSSNIFFLRTSCEVNGPDHLNLSSEQAGSIYSAAIQYPSKKVFLLYTCPDAKFINLNSPSSGFVRTLLDLPNFHFVHMNQTSKLFERVFEELVPNPTTTSFKIRDNVIKFLVAYEFGGTHVDMDAINVRALDNLTGVNFISAESEYSIGNSFFNFEPKHRYLKKLLLTVHKRNIADKITIGLLTTVLRKICSLEELFKFDKFHNLTQCNLKVLVPTVHFSPPGIKDHSSRSETNETTLNFKPHFIQNLTTMQTNELTKQQHSEMHDSGGLTLRTNDPESNAEYRSVYQADGYLSVRKLSPSSNNIYFLETSCISFKPLKTSSTPVMSARQACAIHSTASYNPSREVILLYTCPGFADLSLGLAKELFELPNFSLARINLTDFYSNTLDLKMREALKKSEFPEHQNADMLRLLVLYLYGGTYMDMDIISLKPLADLGKNFIGAEQHFLVANGVLSFEAQHMFIKECLKEAIHMYRPSLWGSAGALLLLKVMLDRCGLEETPPEDWSDWKPFKEVRFLKNCNLTVLPSRYFYAIPYWDWAKFYSESELPDVQSKMQHSYIAHFWNRMGSQPVYMFGKQPYAKLAQRHCNAIFEYKHRMGCFYLE